MIIFYCYMALLSIIITGTYISNATFRFLVVTIDHDS